MKQRVGLDFLLVSVLVSGGPGGQWPRGSGPLENGQEIPSKIWDITYLRKMSLSEDWSSL